MTLEVTELLDKEANEDQVIGSSAQITHFLFHCSLSFVDTRR